MYGDEDSLDGYHYNYQGEDAGTIFDDREGSFGQAMREADIIVENESGQEIFLWPTNLMGKARMEVQLVPEGISDEDLLIRQFGYTLIFVGLVIYTVLFLFRYLRRVLMLAFLTIIAPFVAMTYPIDKLNDGSAQTFNMWIKEYIFNLLIQPVHLVLYTVLIGTSLDFVADNLLYAIVAFGFMLEAEKIMRKFFGFDKASTVEGGSALGGALAMQGINQLRRLTGRNNRQRENNKVSNSENNRITSRRANEGNGVNDLIDAEYRIEDNNNNNTNRNNTNDNRNNNDTEQTAQQRMLDAYDENYMGENWDPAEREAMAREAYEPQGMNYTADEYADILRDTGYSEDEISEIIANDPRYANNIEPVNTPRYANNYNQESTSTTNTRDGQTIPYRRETRTYGAENLQQPRIRRENRNKTHKIKGVAKVAAAGVKYVAPKAARLAVRGTVAGAAGMVGLAAGLASDDNMNVLKYGAAGLGAGWIAGGGIASVPGRVNAAGQRISEGIENSVNNAMVNYSETAYGRAAAKERQQQIDDYRARMDRERRKKYADKLGLTSIRQTRAALDQAQKFRDAGVTDDDIILDAMTAKQFDDERDSRKRIILAGLAQEVGKDKKELDRMQTSLKEKGIDQTEINKYVEAIKDMNHWNY